MDSQEELMDSFMELLRDSDESPVLEDAFPFNLESVESYIEQLGIAKIELLSRLSKTIETQLTKPMHELCGLVKNVRNKMTKREHKLIDFDRHRIELEKLQKKSREKGASSSIDKKIIKQEQAFEHANAEFRKLNELLKRELPLLIQGTSNIIYPAFQSICHLQRAFINKNLELLKILCPNVESKSSILRGYAKKRELYERILSECELLRDSSIDTNEDELEIRMDETGISDTCAVESEKRTLREEFAIAMYDFDGNEQGDLAFRTNDTIKVLEKDESGWWRGSLRGNVGAFPSNYVKTLQM